MARPSETRTLLGELIDLEEEALSRIAGAPEEGRAERASHAIRGVQVMRGLLGSKVPADALVAATAARDALRSALSAGPKSRAPARPSDAGATLSIAKTLNDAALRMVRSEPDDQAAMAELRDLLAPEQTASFASSAAGELFDSLYRRLSALADGTVESPGEAFAEAAAWMDQLTSLMADGANPAPAAATESARVTAAAVSAAPASATGGWTLTEDIDASLVGDFVTECSEYTQGAEAALLELEGDPDQNEAINTVFRAFHTIKGTSGFLGIDLLSDLAHKAENLLSQVRDKKIRCTGGYADLALRANDGVKVLIDGVRRALSGGALEKPAGYDDLIRTLENPEAFGISGEAGAVIPGAAETETTEADGRDAARDDLGEAVEPRPEASPVQRHATVGMKRVAQTMQEQKSVARGGAEAGDSSVRVRTDRLDRLIDMVGELVIAHSMVSEDGELSAGRSADLARKVAHSGKIVRELQDLSMSMRMVPLKPTFLKMSRLVRDLTHKNDRQVAFQTNGEETEIDRNMVDVLADPLIHMIRNAVDHGVESPDERVRAGKDRNGRVVLSAYHAGGNVVVALEDDGRGLSREKIAGKAIERGLIESDKGMSDGDVFSLIFEAGFSTAEKVTEVSGRGVGMDVVRRAVQSLRGRIEIQSELGRGTTFLIKLPLTLAVTDGMLIRVGMQRFILPTASIHVSFRPDDAAVKSVLGRGELVMLRNELIPVVRLHQLFGIPGAIETPTQALLVIIADGERRSAVLVDEILGQQQVVAKSLGEGSGKVPGVAGGAILGDGRVGLILDPAGLIGLARGGANREHRALVEAIG